jgi:transposase-like protein
VAELAKQEGISDVTLYHWRKQAMASGAMSAGPLEKIVSTIARTPHFVLVRKKKT